MAEGSHGTRMEIPAGTGPDDGILASEESTRSATEVERAITQALFGDRRDEAAPGRTLDELLKIQQYERQRLGQELHDTAGQLLTSLHFSIARLRDATEKPEQECLVDEISSVVSQIDQEIRSLTFLQYPAELGEKGVVKAVQALALGFGRRTGIHTHFKATGSETLVADDVSLAVLRVVQEALTNIYRHSCASEAQVLIEQRPAHLHLTIADNGVGIAPSALQRSGVGLASMRGRVEALGGRLSVRKRKVGTSVSAVIPLNAVASATSAG